MLSKKQLGMIAELLSEKRDQVEEMVDSGEHDFLKELVTIGNLLHAVDMEWLILDKQEKKAKGDQ